MKLVKLGYEVGTGKRVDLPLNHLMVTGITQLAGKTTTLESIIKRSERRAVVFRTKIGEKSFLAGTVIPPYFKDRSDWKFIKGIVESTMKMRIDKFEQATIIQLCKQTGGNSILDFKKKVDQKLTEKISNSTTVTLTNLQAYLEEVLPKLTTIQFSPTLDLVDGLNIIDLERFSRDSEVQGLIIASVMEEILYNFKNTTVLLPEAWKFIPQERGSPCKIIVQEFISQGATNGNFVWIDSQAISNVDKEPLKQISEWVLGYQSERNEVKHTLDQLGVKKELKPRADEIMTLGKGIFILSTQNLTKKVYVQPFWLDDERSIQIAKGELKIEDLDVKPEYAHNEIKEFVPPKPVEKTNDEMKNELNEIRVDFFSKLTDLQSQLSVMSQNIHELQNKNVIIDESSIVAKVLQKIPILQPKVGSQNIDIDLTKVVAEVMKKIPISTGGVTYSLSAPEKLQKDWQEETKQKILADIQELDDNAKRMLKYLQSIGKGAKAGELIDKCFFMKSGGSSAEKVKNSFLQLESVQLSHKDKNGVYYGDLKTRIVNLMGTHETAQQDIDNIYTHIVYELLSKPEIVA